MSPSGVCKVRSGTATVFWLLLIAVFISICVRPTGQVAFGQEQDEVQPVEKEPAPAPGEAVGEDQDPAPGATAPAAVADAEPQRVIPLFPGESRLIDAPWPVARVSIANPNIADVDVIDPRRVQIIGISPGATAFVMWSKDEQRWSARVEVEADLGRLENQLQKLFPRSVLEISQVGDVVVLDGTLVNVEQALQLRQFLTASKLNHLDLTSVAGSQQVQLKVRVAEVSRTALKTLGINTFYGGHDFFGGVQIGSSAGPFTPMNVGVPDGFLVAPRPSSLDLPFVVGEGGISVPPTATLFGGLASADLEVFVQALAENQYLRLLAEPTLVAHSGEEAQFLAGGEFPVPIAQLGEGSTTAITIEYREFGVRLQFKPTVLGDGNIRLAVTPEVSELSDVGAVEVLGTRVPSLLTRRVVTTLELKSGQTFAMAGLINRSTNARTSRVPGLGDLPVLGALFRSVRYNTQETELVVLVTASLTEGQSVPLEDVPYPGMTFIPPSDWELYARGQIRGKSAGKIAPVHAQRLKELGLDKLNGPGAWASYERPEPTRSNVRERAAAAGARDKSGG